MKKKIGFIGCGNMGSAMAKGIKNSGIINPEDILIYDVNTDVVNNLANEIGASVKENEHEVANESDILILAVKPNIYPKVLETIKSDVDENTIVVVIAVGVSFEDVYEKLGNVKVARVQPSTPALVGESDSTIYPDKNITDLELEELIELLNTFGKTEVLDGHLMDVVPAIASSAPAYALMLISAMADAGVYQGFPRDQAVRLSAQAVLGASKLVLETGDSPDDLKNNICTPGGTTIEAVCSLEENGFRGIVIDAANACAEKAKSLLNEDSSN